MCEDETLYCLPLTKTQLEICRVLLQSAHSSYVFSPLAEDEEKLLIRINELLNVIG